jgi:anti-sigma regulatory factor (Ser/Thr protein kinase)
MGSAARDASTGSALTDPFEDPFVHPALFYRDDEEYLAGTVPFLLEGLAAGEAVTVSVPGPRLALLRAELGTTAEKIDMYDMREVGRNPGRIIADVLTAAADREPWRRSRIIGEPIWEGRSSLEYPACVQHEALINLAFRGRPVTILCPYDVAGLDEAVLADAEQTHPVVIEKGEERLSSGFAPDEVVARTNAPLPEPAAAAEEFVFDATRLSAARQAAQAAARRVGLVDEDRLDDFVLAIGELIANSVRHGGGAGRLRVWAEDGFVAGEVRDAGQLRDPLAGRRVVGDTERSGRGLRMVQSLSDLVRTHTGPQGTITRIHMRV